MKTALLAAAFTAISLGDALSIPQNFGFGVGFFGVVGVPFEKYASAEAWTPGADLKGRWQVRSGSASAGVETLDLAMDADVFGIPASLVTVERADKIVRRFIVRFDGTKQKKPAKKDAADLFTRVTTNLKALAGEPKAASPGGELTFRYEAATIVARREGAKEVVIEFKPAR
jgi:hypothetical protein